MYTSKVIERFQNPKNSGNLKGANAVGTVGNPTCGDIMKMMLKVEDGVVVDAKFKTFGCAAAIVSSDVAIDLIKGKTLEEVAKLTNKDVLEQIGELPPQKIHCSVLAEEAIAEAIKDYYKRQEKLAKKS